jgi:hypothetical protein
MWDLRKFGRKDIANAATIHGLNANQTRRLALDVTAIIGEQSAPR